MDDDKFAADLNQLFAYVRDHVGDDPRFVRSCDLIERALALIREHTADIIGAPCARVNVHQQKIWWPGRTRAIRLRGPSVGALEDGMDAGTLRWTPEQIVAFVFPELEEAMRTSLDILYGDLDALFKTPLYAGHYRLREYVEDTVRSLAAQTPDVVAAEIRIKDGCLSRGDRRICLMPDGSIHGIRDSQRLRTDRDAVDFLSED